MSILKLFRRRGLHDWKKDIRTDDLKQRGATIEATFADWHRANSLAAPIIPDVSFDRLAWARTLARQARREARARPIGQQNCLLMRQAE